LHARAAKSLETRAAELTEERRKSAAAAVKQLADPERRRAALGRLAARLTTTETPVPTTIESARPRDGG
jgi:hypothetical protein